MKCLHAQIVALAVGSRDRFGRELVPRDEIGPEACGKVLALGRAEVELHLLGLELAR